ARTRTTVCGSPNNQTIRTTCHMGEDQAWRDKRGSWAIPEFVAFSPNPSVHVRSPAGRNVTNAPKTTQLRRMLNSAELEFILEAHNGISARIAEEAGFKGIWASGFALSAQFGVRDNNETSWTQVVDMVEFMADVTSVPILLDGDTGFGNF